MKKAFLVLAMLVLSIVCNEQKGTFLEEKKEKEEKKVNVEKKEKERK